VQIAGGYIATLQPLLGRDELIIVVSDWASGQEVYRVDVKALLAPGNAYARFDLRPDGRLVVAYNNFGSAATLAWFSPVEPDAHVIARGVVAGPSVAGDLIAIKRLVPGADSEFAVIGFSGETVQVFDRDHPNYGTGGIDFDGSLITWHSHNKGIRLSRFPVEPDPPAPVVSPTRRRKVSTRFSLSPESFKAPAGKSGPARGRGSARSRGGAILRLALRAPARVTVRIERKTRSEFMWRGALRLGLQRGSVQRRFAGRIASRPLRPGRYRAVLFTRTAKRAAVRERQQTFRILPR